MIRDVLTMIAGRSSEYPLSLSYAIVHTTVDGLEAFYNYANKKKLINEALFIVYDGRADVIIDGEFVIVGGFTTDSGEGSKGYASVINSLWDLGCHSIREVRCGSALHRRLRTASLTHEDLDYLSGPLVERHGDSRDLLGTGWLHPWKPAHSISHFRLHESLLEVVIGNEDLSDVIFKAYRYLEHISRQKTNNSKANLAAWHNTKKGQSGGATVSEHILNALVALRNERAHSPASSPPNALELLLLDYAFKLHDEVDSDDSLQAPKTG